MKVILTLCALAICSAMSLNAADEAKPAGDKPAGAKPAGDKPKATPEESFKRMDSNHDNKLSKAEFMATPPAKKDAAKAGEKWTALSKGKEELTLDEYKAGALAKKPK